MANVREKVKEVIEDFDDFDVELENLLEHDFADAYEKAMEAMSGKLKALERLPNEITYSNRRVQKIVNAAIEAFNRVWIREAVRIMKPQISSALHRGVLQNERLIKVTEG